MTVYEIITDTIIKRLEAGDVPWQKGWKQSQNLVTRQPYRGINALLTSTQKFVSPYWLTFNQAKKLDGSIKAGARSTPCIFWKFRTPAETDTETETDTDRPRVSCFYHRIFNLEQTSGIESPTPEQTHTEAEQLQECQTIANYSDRPAIQYNGTQPRYSVSEDTVYIPPADNFQSLPEYWSTLYHELIHSTGHERRLGRPFGASYEVEKYTKEELIAEIGAAFLCGHAGIEQATLTNSAAYIQSWISALRGDKRLIVSAAQQAQKAAAYILERQNQVVQPETVPDTSPAAMPAGTEYILAKWQSKKHKEAVTLLECAGKHYLRSNDGQADCFIHPKGTEEAVIKQMQATIKTYYNYPMSRVA